MVHAREQPEMVMFACFACFFHDKILKKLGVHVWSTHEPLSQPHILQIIRPVPLPTMGGVRRGFLSPQDYL
jgi:hypothetical protein